MNSTKYMQTDSRWGGLGYPKSPYFIRNCGCGECSIANIIIEIAKYKNYTPATIQPYCKQFADPHGNGTYHSGIPAMMKHYGLTEVKEHATMKPLWTELAKGNRVAVYLMGSRKGGSKGVKWTSSGHFVCSVGYKYENGKHYVYVKDSYSNSSLRNGWITYEDNMRNDVLKVWSGKLPSGTTPSNTTPPKTDGKLVVDGIGGLATVNRLQEFLGVPKTDGITIRKDLQKYVPALKAYDYGNGSPTVKAMQKWLGLSSPDGLWGSNTSKGLQKKLGVTQDGIAGANTFKALQKYLNEHDKAVYPTQTIIDKEIEACKVQAEYMKNFTYKWQENPTIEKSKKYGTCVTYVACVLQRIGILKSGQYIWISTKKKVEGANSKMVVTYPSGTLKSNKSKLKRGDIIIGGNGKTGAGDGSHIFILTGKWNGDSPYIYDQESASRVRKGKSPQHTWTGNFKMIALIRLKDEVLPKQSLTDKIMDACKVQADWEKNAKYEWESKPTIPKSKNKATCVTYVACVLQRLGYLKSGEYVWQNGKGYGTGKVYGTNDKMTTTYMDNKTLTSLKSKLKKDDIVLLDDNKSGKAGSGGHIFILTGKWTDAGNPYIWDNECAKKGQKARAYSGKRKVLAIVRLK